jgi:oxaloacetate decarboxylase alpha subunit
MKEITFVDTTLRDAHQSLWNGRMTTDMMLPIAPIMDEVGFEALDFMALISMDWCIRNQRENPWDYQPVIDASKRFIRTSEKWTDIEARYLLPIKTR